MEDIETTSGESLWGSTPSPAAASPAQAAPAARRLAIVPKDPPKQPAGARMERRTVPDNDDQATAETVAMMCDYIRAGVKDPQVQAWAQWALDCFGMGVDDARAKFWGVFWCLKHAVKYRHDEPALFRMGERNARDLLTAPAVLVRQASPEEDCDGFTMLACAMLQILGVPSFIVTVKADPKEPGRWSHVFALADVANVGLCALDATPAGRYPGWMIPRQHIFNYQVWDLSGKPIHKKLPVVQPRLNGFEYRPRGMGARPGAVRDRRRRGVGDDVGDIDPLTGDTIAGTGLPPPLVGSGPLQPGQTYAPGYQPSGLPDYVQTATPGSAPAPSALNTFLNDLFGTAGRVATIATAPPGSVVSPSGAVTVGGGVATLTNSIMPYLPFLLVGGVVLYALSASGGKK